MITLKGGQGHSLRSLASRGGITIGTQKGKSQRSRNTRPEPQARFFSSLNDRKYPSKAGQSVEGPVVGSGNFLSKGREMSYTGKGIGRSINWFRRSAIFDTGMGRRPSRGKEGEKKTRVRKANPNRFSIFAHEVARQRDHDSRLLGGFALNEE